MPADDESHWFRRLLQKTYISLATFFALWPGITDGKHHSVPNPPMLIPPELIDHIFSFLRGDKLALEECSKAHPIFSSNAEPHLYADILIPMNYKTAFYKQLSENPHILKFPRTLEFRLSGHDFPSSPSDPEVLLIMSMIPRMANLVSLTLTNKWPYNLNEDFISMFKNCFQQSAIEELCLEGFRNFSLSILDGKAIKKLTFSNCTAIREEESVFTSGASHQSLETLIIRSYHSPNLLLWASYRATSLTTLELRDSATPSWRDFAQLLRACSKTLTRLHLDVDSRYQSIYRFNRQSHSYGTTGRWIEDHLTFPFTLSAHIYLKKVSIFAYISFDSNARIHCALPAILRLIKTAPSAQVFLSFRRYPGHGIRIERLNLSPLLVRIRSDFPTGGICPHMDLQINHDISDCPPNLTIPDVFEVTEASD